jgi:hypothetical protein
MDMSSAADELSKDRYFAIVIGTSVQSLAAQMSLYQSLLIQVETSPPATSRGELELQAIRNLSREKRREIDDVVAKFFQDAPELIENKLIKLFPDALADKEKILAQLNDRHPVPSEVTASLPRFIAERELDELFRERFKEFESHWAEATYARACVVAKSQPSAAEVLGAALLPSIISAFEQFLGALIRTTLPRHPLGLGPLSDAPASVIQRFPEKLDIERYLFDQKVDAFLKGTPTDWRQQLLRWSKIDIGELGIPWDNVSEAIQRRHVLIHNGGRADAAYLQRAPGWAKVQLKVGDQLTCTPGYMRDIIRDFRVLGIIFGLHWAKHFAKATPESVFPSLVTEVYELELQGSWKAAYQIADAAKASAGEEFDFYLLVNWWLCRQRLGLEDFQMRQEIEHWKPPKSDIKLQAARYALLGDYDSVIKSLREYSGGAMSLADKRQLLKEPIFSESVTQSDLVKGFLTGRMITNGPTGGRLSRKQSKRRR